MRIRFTAREREIVTLILEGCSNREIAERFGTAERTIKNQLTTIYAKCGVKNRLQLATRVHNKQLTFST